jgi:hypothetical protein
MGWNGASWNGSTVSRIAISFRLSACVRACVCVCGHQGQEQAASFGVHIASLVSGPPPPHQALSFLLFRAHSHPRPLSACVYLPRSPRRSLTSSLARSQADHSSIQQVLRAVPGGVEVQGGDDLWQGIICPPFPPPSPSFQFVFA